MLPFESCGTCLTPPEMRARGSGRAHSAPPRLLSSVNSHQNPWLFSVWSSAKASSVEMSCSELSSAEHTTTTTTTTFLTHSCILSPRSLPPPGPFLGIVPCSWPSFVAACAGSGGRADPAGLGASSQEAGDCWAAEPGARGMRKRSLLSSFRLFATKGIGSISTRALEEVPLGLGLCLHPRFSNAPWGVWPQ